MPSIFNRRARNSDQSAHPAQTDLNSFAGVFPYHPFVYRAANFNVYNSGIYQEGALSFSQSITQSTIVYQETVGYI